MSHWEASGRSNDWYTPPEVFEALGEHFDLDVASPPFPGDCYVPATESFSANALTRDWGGLFVWMNPPFGGRNGLVPWVDKFFQNGNGIALTPDRTSAPWFQAAWSRADRVLFTRKIRFVRPDGSRGVAPSCGTALWAVGDRGVAALRRAADRGFGILARPLGGAE